MLSSRQTLGPKKALGYLACAMSGVLWSTGFFFGKVALTELPVGQMVLYRFLFASAGILPVVAFYRIRFSRSEWIVALFSAFFGVPVQFLIQFQGLAHTTVSHASLMVGTMPVILALGAVLFAHERIDRIGWVALAGSTLGAGLIALSAKHAVPGQGPTVYGDMLVVLSMVSALFWILLSKRLMVRHPPIVVTVVILLCGTAMLALFVVSQEGLPPIYLSQKVWLALALSGILATACTTALWNWGLGHVPASQAGIFLNFEPLLGSILGITFLGESLGSIAWIGGALILAAAMVLTTRPQPQLEKVAVA